MKYRILTWISIEDIVGIVKLKFTINHYSGWHVVELISNNEYISDRYTRIYLYADFIFVRFQNIMNLWYIQTIEKRLYMHKPNNFERTIA